MFNLSNVCLFEGRLVADPQYGSFNGNNGQVETAMFRVAVERALTSEQRNKVKNGDKTIKTADFVPCKLIGPKVTFLKQFFKQGSAIKVACRYTDYKTTDPQTGTDKYGYMFEVEDVSFTIASNNNTNHNGNNNYSNNGNGNNNYNGGNNYNNNNAQQQPAQQNNNFSMFDEEDMPF